MKPFYEKKIAVLGGGQLGRMLIQSGIGWNLRFKVLDPDPKASCSRLGVDFHVGSLTDFDTVYAFGKGQDLITVEIENVNVDALEALQAEGVEVFPQPHVLRTIQDKRLQKQFYQDNQIPTADFVLVEGLAALSDHHHFLPAVQKSGRGGYDGRGVQVLMGPDDIHKGLDTPGLLEKHVIIEKEISVIVARNLRGEIKAFPAVELVYHAGQNMVDYLICPADISTTHQREVRDLAMSVAEKLDSVGLLAVELFLTPEGDILVNEVAPRPHNSGHQTIEANYTSQYEQHLRAILNLPLGNTSLKSFAGIKPLRGIVTGCNEAFLIDSKTRNEIVKADPKSAEIIHPYFRGQDVNRWQSEWAETWIIFTRRGIDIEAYLGVKAHLEQFKEQLEPKPDDWTGTEWPGRKAGSYTWFEIQDSIDYWREFEKPKISYQEIQFHPSYALDTKGFFGNNKTFFITCEDLYLLAVLNSPLMWWHNWRYLPHMKDEALSPVGFLMEALPIAEPTTAIREATESAVRRLIKITASEQQTHRTVLDWLRVEYAIEKPGNKLQALTDLDSDRFVAEVKRIRGKKLPLTAAGLQALRTEYTRTIEPARTLAAEELKLERTLSDLVNQAYGLTPDEIALLWDTAPPRMPIPKPN